MNYRLYDRMAVTWLVVMLAAGGAVFIAKFGLTEFFELLTVCAVVVATIMAITYLACRVLEYTTRPK